ncbi:UNVERIFIED_CONTAM: hypothetical protein FKN15_010379 [Acipenser sinensis]
MDDGMTEGSQHKPNAYIIKLFDRSVDLAQFSDSTPLYPICRAWMRNSPSVSDLLNQKARNVYRMPAPTSCSVNSSGEPVNLRIPPPLPFTETPLLNMHQLDYCSMYSEESSCSKNPECSWCGGGCRSYQPHSGCGSAGCLGLARFLSDCQSCLVFSGRSDSLPQAPGEFGWCVQNETCIPVTEFGKLP